MEQDANWLAAFRRRLRAWYRRHARQLPWRQTHDPYAIWVSEVMLQQTQVETVIPYYERFLASFPDAEALAAASEQEVLRHWEGLGYYRRARQLHAAARVIQTKHQGEFPRWFDDVHALPGIGRYTAGAILSFACDQRQPILEANTIRLFARLLAWEEITTKSASQQALWDFAERILPRKGCGEFNQALIELGSLICQPQPACKSCPVQGQCAAYAEQSVAKIPNLGKKMVYESRLEAAVVVRCRKRVLLRQCQPGERWAGLWDFPRLEVQSKTAARQRREVQAWIHDAVGPTVAVGDKLTTIKHGVTKYRITLNCYAAEVPRSTRPKAHSRWVDIASLGEYPLSTTGRKIAKLIQRAD